MDYTKITDNAGDLIQYFQNGEETLKVTAEGPDEGPVLLSFTGNMKSSFAPDIKADMNTFVSVNCPLILDFTGVKGISISCVNAMLDMQLHIDKVGKGSITIQNVPGDILAQFKRIGLTELMDIR